MKHLLFVLTCTLTSLSGFASEQTDIEVGSSPLFESKFFTLSTRADDVLCGGNDDGILDEAQIEQAIDYYESKNPNLASKAVEYLTGHVNSEFKEKLEGYKKRCAETTNPDHCILEKYWGNKKLARRVLALFYDTKASVKTSIDSGVKPFEPEHVYSIEKAVRRFPSHVREKISRAKNKKSTLFPDEIFWNEGGKPLEFNPIGDSGLGGDSIAYVLKGTNQVFVNPSWINLAKAGQKYTDLDLSFMTDFRPQFIVHEIAHVVDYYFFWNEREIRLPLFEHPSFVSANQEHQGIIEEAKLSKWPTNWFDAFTDLPDVSEDGVYNGSLPEKFAELVAQYMLLPEELRMKSSEAYSWLRGTFFQGIEYEGYSSCPESVVRPLKRHEKWYSRKLKDQS